MTELVSRCEGGRVGQWRRLDEAASGPGLQDVVTRLKDLALERLAAADHIARALLRLARIRTRLALLPLPARRRRDPAL